jgi:hypothetical protein
MPTAPKAIAAAPACISPLNIGRRNSTVRRHSAPAADVVARKLFKTVRREQIRRTAKIERRKDMRVKAERSRKWSSYVLHGAVILATAFTMISCGGSSKPGSTESTAQTTYSNPAEAGQALQAAIRGNDQSAMTRVLGAKSVALLKSGDAVEDKAAMDSFSAKFDQMNRWVAMTNGSQILSIGADNYAFPIPLVKDSSSRWQFDSSAGQEEITARNIGRNELLAIDAVLTFADAEETYFQKAHDGNPAHQYTQIIVSEPGKQDGLYWDASKTQDPSPLGKLSDFATSPISPLGPGEPQVLDGYSLRLLSAQGDKAKGGAKSYMVNGKMTGGYAVLASPVTYKKTGVMTFIVGKDGVVYQQDLGEKTGDLAAAMKDYNPTDAWTAAE